MEGNVILSFLILHLIFRTIIIIIMKPTESNRTYEYEGNVV
jgi:hypothetical protein